LIERDLILEEVTEITSKLHKKAYSGKDETQSLIQKVNDYQGKVRAITRSMMALVSELSMYHATALRLDDEKVAQEEEFQVCMESIERGSPPSEEARRTLGRMQREQLSHSQAPVHGSENEFYPANYALRTKAEPRPSAYIPEDDIGIPKPVGHHETFHRHMLYCSSIGTLPSFLNLKNIISSDVFILFYEFSLVWCNGTV